ncbi:MAG: hypothetical protein ABSC89_05970 [Verrucomicrobiota bacterium]|jgi:hypothetical protein
MKIFIAYSLVVVGIPTAAGILFGNILIVPVSVIVGLLRNAGLLRGSDEATAAQDFEGAFAWSYRESIKMSVPDRIVHICLDILHGFGAILATGFLFHLLGLSPSAIVLLILAAWPVFFSVAFKQSFRALFGTLAGLVIGWLVILRLFAF